MSICTESTRGLREPVLQVLVAARVFLGQRVNLQEKYDYPLTRRHPGHQAGRLIMSWLRSTGPKPTTRYSFTVNFESHPELEPLAHHLWSLSPAPTSRNQAITQLLQAGFQAMLLQGGGPPSASSLPRAAAPATSAPPASSHALARPPVTTPAQPTEAFQPLPPAPAPVSSSTEPVASPASDTLSPAASRFINQFDD